MDADERAAALNGACHCAGQRGSETVGWGTNVNSAAAHSNGSCDVLCVEGCFQNRHMIGGHKKLI